MAVFLLVLVLEGLGLNSGREATFIISITIFPLLLCLMSIMKKQIAFPAKSTLFFLLFLISSLISTLFSKEPSQSIPYFFYLISLFSVYIFSYNYKSILEKYLINVILSIAVLFCLYSIMLNSHLLNLFLPIDGFQFVYSRYSSHNHLGDFLALPITLTLFYVYTRKYTLISLIGMMLFVPLLIFSYSRSAYITTILMVCIVYVHFLTSTSVFQKLISKLLISALLVSGLLLYITVSSESKSQPIPSQVNRYLAIEGGLKNKLLFGKRPEYLQQGYESVLKHPIIGVGPNNFLYVSKTYAVDSYYITNVAHNVFLEILVGEGIFGLAFFSLFLIYVLRSKKSKSYFLFLAMLINFQTDYTYAIYSFLALFFVLASQTITEKESVLKLQNLALPNIKNRKQ